MTLLLKPGATYYGRLYTHSPITDAAADADSLPTITVYKNNAAYATMSIVPADAGDGYYTLQAAVPAACPVGSTLAIAANFTMSGAVRNQLVDTIQVVTANAYDSLIAGSTYLYTSGARAARYVATLGNGGNDANDGLTWATPKLTVAAAGGNDRDIYVGPGSFSGPVDLSAYSGIRLILDPGTTLTHNDTFTLKACNGMQIIGNGGLIANTKAGVSGSGMAVHQQNETVGARIRDLRVTSTGTGVFLESCGDGWIENCDIAGSEYGLSVYTSTGKCTYVLDCTIRTSGWTTCSTLAVSGSNSNVMLSRCLIQSTGGAVSPDLTMGVYFYNDGIVELVDCVVDVVAGTGTDCFGVGFEFGLLIMRGGSISTTPSTAFDYHAYAVNAAAEVRLSGVAWDASKTYGSGTVSDLTRDSMTAQGYTVARSVKLDNLNATVGSRLPTSSYTAPLSAASTRTALGMASADLDDQLDAILAAGGASGAAADATAAKLETMLEADGLNYRFTGDALDNVDCIGMGAGGTENTITVTDDESNPLDGVAVWVTTDEAGSHVVQGTYYTDALGRVTVSLQAPGTYYVWRQLAGYNFDENPYELELP
jgi:hypothetical protein